MNQKSLLTSEDLMTDDDLRKSSVFNRIYDELRSIAHHIMKGEHRLRALQPTELVNEAYLKLLPAVATDELTKRRFLRFGARAMRQVLTDQARRLSAEKRGGEWCKVTLRDVAAGSNVRAIDLLALDAAMEVLIEEDPRLAEMTELYYIGGMTGDQIAEHFEISRSTVTRELSLARAILLREIDRFESEHPTA